MSREEKIKDLHFDAVLPSHLLLNQEIESSAKIFYAIVRNLTRIEGYCYASNEYLSTLMEVDERTIRRWLETLSEHGYLEVELDKQGFLTKRSIYISDKFKEFLRKDKNVRLEGTKTSVSNGNKCPTKEDSKIKEDREETVCSSNPIGLSISKIVKTTSDGKEVIIRQDDIFRRAIAERKEWTTAEILEAWEILVECEGVVNDGFLFIAGTIKNRKVKKKFDKMAQKVNAKNEERSWNTGIIKPTDCPIPSEIDITKLL